MKTFPWTVVDQSDLLYDDISFSEQCVVGEGRVQQNVAEQVPSKWAIVIHDVGMEAGIVATRKRSHLATRLINPGRYVARTPAARSKEVSMFGQMRNARLTLRLVLWPRVHEHAYCYRVGVRHVLGHYAKLV